MKKQKSHAFRKDIYLLGIDSSNDKVWLEEPSWDCNWYWGFGYVERYTSQNPPSAKDISSHTHIDSEFKKDGVINLNGHLKETTFTKNEGVELNFLFTKFYELKKLAEQKRAKEKGSEDEINKVQIPAITKRIIEILSPES